MFIDDITYLHENSTHYIMIYNKMPYAIFKETNEDPYFSQLKEIEESIKSNKLELQMISDEEWCNIISNITGMQIPAMISAEETIRIKRDSLLNEADTILLKYQEQVELGIIDEDNEYRLALLQYKENLRNIPEQKEFPENVIWPELPKRA